MDRGISGLKRIVFQAAAVAGIGIFLVFSAACSGDLLGYIKAMVDLGGGIDLPKTGQTDSYASGDDGDLQMGVAWPAPRFTDNGNGTITDNLTGLMWDQSGDTATGTKNWTQALIDCMDLSLGGHDNWRLPNVGELESLINAAKVNPEVWLNDQGFNSVQAQRYWSSSTWAWDLGMNYAWLVDMSDGSVIGTPKSNGYRVLAVRSGQTGGTVSLPRTGQIASYATGDDGDLEMVVAWPVPRFTDNGNGTITDNLTALVWEQSPSGTSNWANALDYANDLVLGGHDNWRLPNRKELRSLINYAKADTAAWLEEPEQGFSLGSVLQGSYWSSTTWATNPDNAELVRMSDGTVTPDLKTLSFYVMAVRGGQ